ncbi:DUF695 domain-containing protein [Algicola sagamiensis]|uniref:DUF695 domain-containing protein n=1 Tax=Algicola sagamiensis TaxID=163869 RepID=UPI000379E313|nr:DUF695 domain-containing protein [Algicola sagamiensis]
MADTWHFYPKLMDERQLWISFNESYDDIAESDSRENLLRIEIKLKKPTREGMPTNEEYEKLCALEDIIVDAVCSTNGVFVGRVTYDGRRYYSFYFSCSRSELSSLLHPILDQSGYKARFVMEHDPQKLFYWQMLYPSDDDWQMIRDLLTLDQLNKHGDNKGIARQVFHWVYFTEQEQVDDFSDWLVQECYQFQSVTEQDEQFCVRFYHIGTMRLSDISSHTLKIARSVGELGGEYDGWESSVEKLEVKEEVNTHIDDKEAKGDEVSKEEKVDLIQRFKNWTQHP